MCQRTVSVHVFALTIQHSFCSVALACSSACLTVLCSLSDVFSSAALFSQEQLSSDMQLLQIRVSSEERFGSSIHRVALPHSGLCADFIFLNVHCTSYGKPCALLRLFHSCLTLWRNFCGIWPRVGVAFFSFEDRSSCGISLLVFGCFGAGSYDVVPSARNC